jgi:formate-dependent nitrite reductase membrane component NrfD
VSKPGAPPVPRPQRTRAVKWALVATIPVAGLCLAWWWPAAWAPALLALVLVATLIAMTALDRRRTGPVRPVRRAPAFLRRRIQFAGAAIVFLTMAAMSTVLAAWLLDARDVAIGTYAGFLLMALLSGPFWILALAEEVSAADRIDTDARPSPRR